MSTGLLTNIKFFKLIMKSKNNLLPSSLILGVVETLHDNFCIVGIWLYILAFTVTMLKKMLCAND